MHLHSPPLSDESDVGSDVGMESALLLSGGDVLLSKSSELSDNESSNQMFNIVCNVTTCWSLYMRAINWTMVTLQNDRCGHDIRYMNILSMLSVNRFQTIWFCIETAFGWARCSTPTCAGSGMCRMLRNNSRQLLTLSHCSNESFESFSKIFFMWSTTARIARISLNDSLLAASNVFKSLMVWRPTSVRIIISMENKLSTGIVKLTRIRMIRSIIVYSLTLIRNGNKSLCTFCPMARRNVRSVWSSHVNLQWISLSKSENSEKNTRVHFPVQRIFVIQGTVGVFRIYFGNYLWLGRPPCNHRRGFRRARRTRCRCVASNRSSPCLHVLIQRYRYGNKPILRRLRVLRV